MDPCFSGEDLVIKTRKPYTITKHRERWTEEEHNRFLEALKLYGRAWQRIEEHIGTKTAIQIRSHAQKFFTKLEKEASVKGSGNGLDIEIPPPRPKRKPANPYPRKACGASVLHLGLKDGKPSDATSTSLSMAFVKGTEDLSDGTKQQNSDQERDDCVEDLNLELVAPCSSPTSTNSSIASEVTERSNFRQFFPLVDGSRNQNGSAEFLFTAKPIGNHVEEAEEKQLLTDNSRVTLDLCVSPEESSHGEMVHDPIDETSHNPRHVPVHILGGSSGNMQNTPVMPFMQSIPNQTAGAHGDQIVYTNAAATASENVGDGPRPAIPPPYLNTHPFLAPMMNHEDYQPFMQMSSTFSSLILSALAQNAAMYAAASLASTGWPWFNLGTPLEPSANSSGIPQSRPMNPTSSIAAIAGATVAAATAWWAANGLLPFCPQYHPGFACSPAAQMAGSQSGNINGEARGNGDDPTPQCRPPDAELFNAPNSTLKPSSSSSSDSEASEAEMLDGGLNLAENEEADKSDGSNKFKNKKQLDRSSSGSNTLSSSEVEPDAMEIDVKVDEEKHIKTRENKEEPNAVLPTTDTSSRRSRSSSSPTDPWKEVSEEGRLAFRALFSREVLPQSFPPLDLKNKVKKQCSKSVEEDGDELTIFKLGGNQETESSSFDIGKTQDSHLNEELKHTKVKAYRTGFRLYKRCSMEAKETQVPEEHKDPKKLRLSLI